MGASISTGVSNVGIDATPRASRGYIAPIRPAVSDAEIDAIHDRVNSLNTEDVDVDDDVSFIGCVGETLSDFGDFISDKWDSVCDFFTGDDGVLDVLKKCCATICNAATALLEGVTKVFVGIGNAVIVVGGGVASIFTGLYDGFQAIKGKITGEEWNSVTKKFWDEKIKPTVTANATATEELYDYIRDDTAYGEFLHDSYGYENVRKYGRVAGEIAAVIAVSAVAAPAVAAAAPTMAAGTVTATVGAAVSGTQAFGNSTAEAWANGASTLSGIINGAGKGAIEAAEYFVGGKLLGDGAKLAKQVLVNSGTAYADVYARSAVDAATSKMSYSEALKNNGGHEAAIKQAATGAIFTIGGNVVNKGVTKVKSAKQSKAAAKVSNKTNSKTGATKVKGKASNKISKATNKAKQIKDKFTIAKNKKIIKKYDPSGNLDEALKNKIKHSSNANKKTLSEVRKTGTVKEQIKALSEPTSQAEISAAKVTKGQKIKSKAISSMKNAKNKISGAKVKAGTKVKSGLSNAKAKVQQSIESVKTSKVGEKFKKAGDKLTIAKNKKIIKKYDPSGNLDEALKNKIKHSSNANKKTLSEVRKTGTVKEQIKALSEPTSQAEISAAKVTKGQKIKSKAISSMKNAKNKISGAKVKAGTKVKSGLSNAKAKVQQSIESVKTSKVGEKFKKAGDKLTIAKNKKIIKKYDPSGNLDEALKNKIKHSSNANKKTLSEVRKTGTVKEQIKALSEPTSQAEISAAKVTKGQKIKSKAISSMKNAKNKISGAKVKAGTKVKSGLSNAKAKVQQSIESVKTSKVGEKFKKAGDKLTIAKNKKIIKKYDPSGNLDEALKNKIKHSSNANKKTLSEVRKTGTVKEQIKALSEPTSQAEISAAKVTKGQKIKSKAISSMKNAKNKISGAKVKAGTKVKSGLSNAKAKVQQSIESVKTSKVGEKFKKAGDKLTIAKNKKIIKKYDPSGNLDEALKNKIKHSSNANKKTLSEVRKTGTVKEQIKALSEPTSQAEISAAKVTKGQKIKSKAISSMKNAKNKISGAKVKAGTKVKSGLSNAKAKVQQSIESVKTSKVGEKFKKAGDKLTIAKNKKIIKKYDPSGNLDEALKNKIKHSSNANKKTLSEVRKTGTVKEQIKALSEPTSQAEISAAKVTKGQKIKSKAISSMKNAKNKISGAKVKAGTKVKSGLSNAKAKVQQSIESVKTSKVGEKFKKAGDKLTIAKNKKIIKKYDPSGNLDEALKNKIKHSSNANKKTLSEVRKTGTVKEQIKALSEPTSQAEISAAKVTKGQKIKSKAISSMKNAKNKISGAKVKAGTKVKSGLSNAKTKIQNSVNNIKNKVGESTSKIKNKASGAKVKTGTKVKSGLSNAKTKIQNSVNNIKNKVGESTSKIKKQS